jgi:hypothetical protein
MAKGNYNKWRNFLFVITKYNAWDHAEEETGPHLADVEWRSAEVDIILWIYGPSRTSCRTSFFRRTLVPTSPRRIEGPGTLLHRQRRGV